jgi:hypothetical protein
MSPKDLRRPAEKPPKGWLTCREWAARWDLSVPHTNHLLADGVRVKKVQKRSFRVQSGSRLYPVPHYRSA